MGDLIEYNAVSNAVNAVDRFDSDNFYPFDGDDDDSYYQYNGLDTDNESMDVEFSNGEGNFGAKVKGLFKKGGVKEAVTARQEGLGGRLAEREAKLGGRIGRREMRIESRGRRKDMRQSASWNQESEPVKQQADVIASKSEQQGNTEATTSLNNLKEGFATSAQEGLASKIIFQARKDVAEGRMGFESASIITKDGEVADTWWKKQSTGAKIAIVGGGVVALGLGIWGIVKLMRK